MFTATDYISRMTICPPHRSSLGIGWQITGILIIRQLTALASSASVVQISGGSTPLAKEGGRFFVLLFLLAPPTFFRYATLFYPKGLSATPLDPQLQMDKYKEITGFDVYSVRTFNHAYKHVTT